MLFIEPHLCAGYLFEKAKKVAQNRIFWEFVNIWNSQQELGNFIDNWNALILIMKKQERVGQVKRYWLDRAVVSSKKLYCFKKKNFLCGLAATAFSQVSVNDEHNCQPKTEKLCRQIDLNCRASLFIQA